jgi:hypothetical protein
MELKTTIVCPSCHSSLQGKPKFCMKCGAKIDYDAIKQNSKQSKPISELKSLKPSLGLTTALYTNVTAHGNGMAIEPSSKKADYWEPQKMKALIFSIASAIGILLTALGLWYISSLEPALSTYYLARIELLRFMLFGVLIVIGSLFFMTLMEVRSRA